MREWRQERSVQALAVLYSNRIESNDVVMVATTADDDPDSPLLSEHPSATQHSYLS